MHVFRPHTKTLFVQGGISILINPGHTLLSLSLSQYLSNRYTYVYNRNGKLNFILFTNKLVNNLH